MEDTGGSLPKSVTAPKETAPGKGEGGVMAGGQGGDSERLTDGVLSLRTL